MTSSQQNTKLKVAVVGAGAFGRNHARVYHELQDEGQAIELVAVVDADGKRAAAVGAEFGAAAFDSVSELLARTQVQAASVAVPTIYHHEVARALMQAGVDVLIEKPLAASLEEADDLVRTAERLRRVAQAGHLERFNPAVRATVPLLTRPMFFEVHRLSPFGPRALDVDVVLDLMIHDVDIVLSFTNSPLQEIRAVGLPILSSKVDIANVRMEFESGCVANLTASRVSTERVRKLRFFQPKQYISIDYSRQDVLVFTVADGNRTPAAVGAAAFDPRQVEAMLASLSEGKGLRRPPGLPPEITISKPEVLPEEPLKAELRLFLQAVRRGDTPVVTLADGRRALAVALEILASIREHSRRAKLDVLGV